MYQLRNLINQRNVKKDPSKAVTACEEFFELVVEAHVVSAVMTVFDMASLDDTPSSTFFSSDASARNSLERRKIVIRSTQEIVTKFVDLSHGVEEPKTLTVRQKENASPDDKQDGVQEYACAVLTLGLLFLKFKDAIKEGDGNRIICCWRYFLLHFKASNRTNYSIKAFTLLAQYTFLLSPRMAHQLLWSRTVNTHGRPGKNIPCDLHMEHINREAKSALSGLGSNITDTAVTRVGKCIGQLLPVMDQFDEVNNVALTSERHSRRSTQADMDKLIKVLHKEKCVFTHTSKHCHKNFKTIQRNMIRHSSVSDLNSWMKQQLDSILMCM